MQRAEGEGCAALLRHIGVQRRTWAFQRAGWLLLLLLIAAAISGLFGDGPISPACAKADGLVLCYQRFCRSSTECTLEVTVAADAGSATLWIDEGYLGRVQLQSMVPEGNRTASSDGAVSFAFRAAGPQVRVRLVVRHTVSGWADLRLGVAGGPTIAVRQFVYP